MKKKDIQFNLNASIDATDALNKATDVALETLKEPLEKSSNIITNLLGFVNETIDTGLYIYKENLHYYKAKCHAKIEEKIDKIPKENLTMPDVGIVGETLENLKYNLDKDYLVELYSSIIAKNVDNRTKKDVHPTFISIIKDLSFNDIKLLEAIYKYQNNDNKEIPIISLEIISEKQNMNKTFKNEKYFIELNGYNYTTPDFEISLENLVKLNLVSIDFQHWLKNESCYETLKNKANEIYKTTFKPLEIIYKCECNIGIKEKGTLHLTNLGFSLLKICLS